MERESLERLERNLVPLEARRRREVLLAGALFLLGGLFLIGPLWLRLSHRVEVMPREVWSLLASAPMAYALLRLNRFRADLKGTLLTPLAEAQGYRYTPHLGFFEREAYASGLLAPADRYEGEDLLEGEVRGFPFRSGDLALYRRVRTRSGRGYRRFFRGTLYRFGLPFSLPGEVYVFPQGKGVRAGENPLYYGIPFVILVGIGVYALLFAEGWENKVAGAGSLFASLLYLYWFGHTWASMRSTGKPMERVALESPAFEAFFEARGDDQVGARRVLTPRVQEALVGMRQSLGKPLWLAFREREVWLLVGGGNRFEPSLLRPLTRETLEAYAHRWTRELREAAWLLQILGLEVEARKRGLAGREGEDQREKE